MMHTYQILGTIQVQFNECRGDWIEHTLVETVRAFTKDEAAQAILDFYAPAIVRWHSPPRIRQID